MDMTFSIHNPEVMLDTRIWVAAGLLVFAAYFIIGSLHMAGGSNRGFWYWIYGAFIYACGFGHLVMIYFMMIDASLITWRIVVWTEVLTAIASVGALFRPRGYAA